MLGVEKLLVAVTCVSKCMVLRRDQILAPNHFTTPQHLKNRIAKGFGKSHTFLYGHDVGADILKNEPLGMSNMSFESTLNK